MPNGRLTRRTTPRLAGVRGPDPSPLVRRRRRLPAVPAPLRRGRPRIDLEGRRPASSREARPGPPRRTPPAGSGAPRTPTARAPATRPPESRRRPSRSPTPLIDEALKRADRPVQVRRTTPPPCRTARRAPVEPPPRTTLPRTQRPTPPGRSSAPGDPPTTRHQGRHPEVRTGRVERPPGHRTRRPGRRRLGASPRSEAEADHRREARGRRSRRVARGPGAGSAESPCAGPANRATRRRRG